MGVFSESRRQDPRRITWHYLPELMDVNVMSVAALVFATVSQERNAQARAHRVQLKLFGKPLKSEKLA